MLGVLSRLSVNAGKNAKVRRTDRPEGSHLTTPTATSCMAGSAQVGWNRLRREKGWTQWDDA